MLLEGGEEVARARAAVRRGGRRNRRRRRVHAVPRRLAARGPARGGGPPPRVRRRRDRGVAPRRAAVAPDRRRGRGDTHRRMTMPVIIDCDPGHDDAIAILLCAGEPGARAARRHDRLRQPDAREDDGERASACWSSPVARTTCRSQPAPTGRSSASSFVAAYVHGETGLDGPELPPPQGRDPVAQHAVDFLAERVAGHERPYARSGRPADERRPAARAAIPSEAPDRADRAHGRRDRGGQRHPGGRVQHLGRPRGRAPRVHERHGRDDDRPRRHAQGADDAGARGAAARERPPRAHRRRAVRLLLPLPRAGSTASTARRSTTRSRSRTCSGAVLVETVDRGVVVDTGGELSRGRTYVDLWRAQAGRRTRTSGSESTANAFLELLLERIASLG